MIIGYARVSTKGQSSSGNSIEEQENKLLEKGCNEYFKESYTGTKVNRPVLVKVQIKFTPTL